MTTPRTRLEEVFFFRRGTLEYRENVFSFFSLSRSSSSALVILRNRRGGAARRYVTVRTSSNLHYVTRVSQERFTSAGTLAAACIYMCRYMCRYRAKKSCHWYSRAFTRPLRTFVTGNVRARTCNASWQSIGFKCILWWTDGSPRVVLRFFNRR